MIGRIRSYFRGETYQARAFRGSALSVGGLAAHNIIRLGSNLILTRLLFPEAFGLMALVSLVLGAAAMFSDLGLRGSVIRDARGLEHKFLDTIWTLQILRGLILATVIFFLADPLAQFYDAPLLAGLLRVAALIPLLQGFSSTKKLSLNRELQLGRLVMLQILSQLVGIAAMIGLSITLGTVWALLIGTVFSVFVEMVLSHLMLGRPRNRLAWDTEAVGSILRFGKYIFLATMAGFLIRQGDRAILGKFVSLDNLAFYNIGFLLASVPLLVGQAVSDRIIYPLYARRPPAESLRNRRKIAKARRLLTGVLVAGALFAGLIGIEAVNFLYDDRYMAAGPILVLIALGSLPILITESYVKLPLAVGLSGQFAIFQIVRAVAQVCLLLLLVPVWGLAGAAVAPGLATIVVYPVLILTIYHLRGWDPGHDAVYMLASMILGSGVVWLNWPSVAPLFMAP